MDAAMYVLPLLVEICLSVVAGIFVGELYCHIGRMFSLA